MLKAIGIIVLGGLFLFFLFCAASLIASLLYWDEKMEREADKRDEEGGEPCR